MCLVLVALHRVLVVDERQAAPPLVSLHVQLLRNERRDVLRRVPRFLQVRVEVSGLDAGCELFVVDILQEESQAVAYPAATCRVLCLVTKFLSLCEAPNVWNPLLAF